MNSKNAGTEADYPRPAYAWYVVFVLTLAYIVSFIDRQILALLVEPIKRDLAISDTQMSLLMGFAFALLYTLLGIPIGRLVDRASRRLVIVSGISVWCLMTAFCGLARNYAELFVARVGVGVGEATLGPGALSMISDYFAPEKRAAPLGFYAMGITVGSGLAMLVGGEVIDRVSAAGAVIVPVLGKLYAWQTVFIVVGLPGLLVAMLMLTVREPERRGTVRPGKHFASGNEPVSVREAARFLFQRRTAYAGIILGMSGAAMMGYASLSWMPAMYVRTWGWSVADVAWVQGMVLLVMGPISVNLTGWLADARFSRGQSDAHMRVFFYFGIVMLVSGIAFPLMPNGWLAAAGFALNVLGTAGLTTLATAALMIVTPNQLRGQVSAVYYLIISLTGLTIGPTAVAVMTDYVFRDESAIRYSISVVAGITAGFGLFAVWLNLGGYGAAIEEQRAGEKPVRE